MLKLNVCISACFVIVLSLFTCDVNATLLDAQIGARASGMGSAVVASPSDPLSALFYNTAGLADIKGTKLAVGAGYAEFKLRYKNIQGYDEENSSKAFVPNFSFSTDSASPIVFGFGAFSSIGVGYKFEKDPAHGITGDIESSAGILSLTPGLAYKLTPSLSVGLQLIFGYGITENKSPYGSTVLKAEANGTGLGAALGMIYSYSEALNLGISWHSPMHVSQNGDAKIGGVKYDFDVDIYSPQTLAAGIGYNITPKFLITGSVKWSDWSYFDRSKSTMNNVEFPFSKNSRDGFRYTLGCEYTVSDLLTLRAGFIYDPYSIKKEWLSPTLADATFYNLSIGASFTIEKYEIDIFLSGSKIESRKVSYSQTGYTGKYEGYTFPFTGIDLTYTF